MVIKRDRSEDTDKKSFKFQAERLKLQRRSRVKPNVKPGMTSHTRTHTHHSHSLLTLTTHKCMNSFFAISCSLLSR